MKGDFSRSTFKGEKHFNSVRMQQGRVQLDSDWNEQVDIQRHLDQATRTDVIGVCGAPKSGGFAIGFTTDNQDLTIAPGRIYVDGILCEVDASWVTIAAFLDANHVEVEILFVDGREFEQDQWIQVSGEGAGVPVLLKVDEVNTDDNVLTLSDSIPAAIQSAARAQVRRITTYATQPDLPLSASPTLDGTYLVYLDVWQHHVTALEDSELREVALGGPDTATRAKTLCQVKHLSVPAGTTCESALVDWDELTAASSAALQARAEPDPTSSDPCVVAPSAGYRGLENQLYRIEIHDSGANGTATFKWSRENGSIVTDWVGKTDDDLEVASAGQDAVLGFSTGDWVELLEDSLELNGNPGTLVQLSAVEGNVLTIDSSTATGSVDRDDFPLNPRIRCWDLTEEDGTVPRTVPDLADGYVAVEDGIEVQFRDGEYRAGDYWLIPARTVSGDVDWPALDSGEPVPQQPLGIGHRYCKLAVIMVDPTSGTTNIEDCREQFPPLTNICAEDVCFDDDECEMGADTVQDALEALCMRPTLRYVGGDGQEGPPGQVLVGLVEVGVEDGLGRPFEGVGVTFTVTGGGGQVSPEGETQFDSDVMVPTDGNGFARCHWQLGELGENLVVASIGSAAERLHVRFHSTAETATETGGDWPTIEEIGWTNDQEMSTTQFTQDVWVRFSRAMAAATLNRSTFVVTLETPVEQKQNDGSTVRWYHSIIVWGRVGANPNLGVNLYQFIPEYLISTRWFDATERFPGEDKPRRLRCRVRLIANDILDSDGAALDGEALGEEALEVGGPAYTNLLLPTGDGRTGGDFESWFWLKGKAAG